MNNKPPPPSSPVRRPATKHKKAPVVVGKPPIAPDDPEPGAGTDLPLTHEREESIGDTGNHPDAVIEQARKDLDAGLVDTDLREQAGVDEQQRREMLRRGGR
jgi:hypothetical protein